METLHLSIPLGVISYSLPVRHCAGGERISRACLLIPTQPTTSNVTTFALTQYRGGAPLGAAGAVGQLTWPTGLTPGSFRDWEFALPAILGNAIVLQEDDVLVLTYSGPAAGTIYASGLDVVLCLG